MLCLLIHVRFVPEADLGHTKEGTHLRRNPAAIRL